MKCASFSPICMAERTALHRSLTLYSIHCVSFRMRSAQLSLAILNTASAHRKLRCCTCCIVLGRAFSGQGQPDRNRIGLLLRVSVACIEGVFLPECVPVAYNEWTMGILGKQSELWMLFTNHLFIEVGDG